MPCPRQCVIGARGHFTKYCQFRYRSAAATAAPGAAIPGVVWEDDMLTRRHALLSGAAGIAALALGRLTWPHSAEAAKTYEVTHTDAEWRKMLSPEAYQVLREEDTERPFTSSLQQEHRTGTFACAGCDLPLYSSKTKFDSGTGWPSFWAILVKAVDRNHRPLLRHGAGSRLLPPLRWSSGSCVQRRTRRPACAIASTACR